MEKWGFWFFVEMRNFGEFLIEFSVKFTKNISNLISQYSNFSNFYEIWKSGKFVVPGYFEGQSNK
jgi:hypothetical protein